MTSIEQAQKTLEQFVADERKGCHIQAILEDEQDFFAQLALDPGQSWRVGEAFVFVSKATGRLWQGSPGEVLDKIEAMSLSVS